MNIEQDPYKREKPFSQTLRRLMGKTNPALTPSINTMQRSFSNLKQNPINFPTLTAHTLKNSNNHKSKSAALIIRREASEKINLHENKEVLRSINHTASQLTSPAKRRERKDQSSMEKEVDALMNEVIVAHSPKLVNNSAINRSISTKKFRNVRVMTHADKCSHDDSANGNLMIKEMLSFMMRHSKASQRTYEEDPEMYDEDISRQNPVKLVKLTEVMGLYPMNLFRREEEMYLNKPLNSENYIRQLRAGKSFVKEVHLKKH